MTNVGRAGINVVLWVPATVLGVLAEGAVINGANAIGARNLAFTVLLGVNLVPALAASLVVFLPAAVLLNRGRNFGGARGHMLRCVALYAIVVTLAVLYAIESSSPDFWLYQQLILWPGVVAAGGAVSDLWVWGLYGQRPARRAA